MKTDTNRTKYLPFSRFYLADHGWLKSRFHFSFAEYYNPANIRFGPLRVLNDDLVAPGTGFPPHPHRDMEIVSYIVRGELTHEDNMGNRRTLKRGHVQYMSAGTGVVHSESNEGTGELRLLQIWILPDQRGLAPNYGDREFAWEERRDRWFPMVSGPGGGAPIVINQDTNFFSQVTDKPTHLPVAAGRQAYLVLIEGRARVGQQVCDAGDALEIHSRPTEEFSLPIEPEGEAHFLVMDMPGR